VKKWQLQLTLIVVAGVALALAMIPTSDRLWLPGDSHVHSRASLDYDYTKDPPQPLASGDGRYPIAANAQKGREHGLAWMVTTDHGGPDHAKYNLTKAYAELQASRESEPGVLQFYGMELNMPGMDHHTLIIPNSREEASVLYGIEHQFDSQDTWPPERSRYTEEHAGRALTYMKQLPRLPLLFANHPSRSAAGIGQYGMDEPRELRAHNDLAPDVYHGMEGAPGRQAAGLVPGHPEGFRGAYVTPGAYTMGGFDQMTAIVGGLWDSMLGEGRRFWILAASDSHVHYTEADRPGLDFWPGQYQKTYVHAVRSYDGVLDGLRGGRIFAVAGDLISELNMHVGSGGENAGIGETLRIQEGSDVMVTVSFRGAAGANANGDTPLVSRVDLIAGDVRGPVQDPNTDRNDTARVVRRFTARDWTSEGDLHTFTMTLPRIDRGVYLRLRGTNTQELEPSMDAPGENPWSDLWFYSNPVFVELGND
jgi:hypothetical protein